MAELTLYWQKSLRNYPAPESKQNKKRSRGKIVADIELSARNQWLNNSALTQHTPRSSHDKMHLPCCTCERDSETYQSTWFRTRCCTRQYMCYDCYLDRQIFKCNNCFVILYHAAFECFDAFNNKETYPTCDTCSKTTMPEYILPCNNTICKQCAERETFFKYVTDGKRETRQIFLGCTNHGSTKTLHALQRVHQVFYGKNRNVEGLACVYCKTCLNGKSFELNCGHYTCMRCISYCFICEDWSPRIGVIDIPRINIESIIQKERPCNEEYLKVKHLQNSYSCSTENHTCNRVITLLCGEDLCVECMETMAGKNLVTLQTDESGATEDYCICTCFRKRGKHIMSLCALKTAALEIKYVTSFKALCSQRSCFNQSEVKFRHCGHTFCITCVLIMLNLKYNKRKIGPKIQGEREFCICNTFGRCGNAVPTDILSQYVESNAANATSVLDPQKEMKTSGSSSSVVKSVPKRNTVENMTSVLDPHKEMKTPSSSSSVVTSVPKSITVENKTSVLDPHKEMNTPRSFSLVVKSVPKRNTVENRTSALDPQKEMKTPSSSSSVVTSVPKSITVENKKTCDVKMVETANSTPRSSCDKQTQLSFPEESVELESDFLVTDTNDFDANQACSDAKDSKQTNNESKSLKEKIHLTKTYLKDKTMDYLCSAQQFVNKIDVVNTLLPKQPQQTSNRGEKRMATGDCLRDQREILGIPNVGLTCYASCVLQVLGQTPGFKKRLDISCQKSDQLSQNHVDKLLNDLLENVNVGSDGDFIIDWFLMEKLMQRVFKIDRSFRRYEENDCHSFLMTLLNALRKEESENETGEVQSDRKFKDGNEYGSKDGKETAATNKKDLCPAVIFESRLVSKFTYTPCRHEEEVDDQLFRSILVPVRHDFLPLKDALNLFFKGEDFPHNILPCRSCEVSNENTVTTRVLQISKAPMVLMLQLARFEEVQMSESYKKLRKTNHQVMFEKELILDQCTDGQKLQYELYGVVLHTGSMLGGHYTSCVRKQETNRWFYCSDSAVREIKEYSIFQEWNLRNAYVLFYNRKA